MGVNPMQKKARNSFLLGLVITLIICLIIGGVVYFLLTSKEKEKEEERGVEVTAYVLNTDVKSGQIITSDLLSTIVVYENMVPQNYIDSSALFNMQYEDIDGNILKTSSDGLLYINEEDSEFVSISSKSEDKNKVLVEMVEVESEQNPNEIIYKFYKTRKDDQSKVVVELTKNPTIAKINLNKNSILTTDAITKNQMVTNDLRYVEYNMLVLPTTVGVGSYIDIRLTLPNGQDLIVVSHKEIKTLLGDTVGIELTEGEILLMENAIVEAYIMSASKLYAIQYVEPGMQTAAIPTYVQNPAVHQLILENDNIVGEAKDKLATRYKKGEDGYLTPEGEIRGWINNETGKYATESQENVEAGLKKEIENAKAAREAYLSGLMSY